MLDALRPCGQAVILGEPITRRFKLEDINADFETMTRGELVRAVVELPA